MSLSKRIKGWFRKASSVASIMIPAGARAIWSEKRYDNYAKEAYLKNVIAFRSIQLIAQAVASVKWNVFKQSASGKLIEIDSHPIMALLKRPNPEESFTFFMEKMTAYHVLTANSFIEKVALSTGKNAGTPRELYTIRPDYIAKILVNGAGAVAGYEVRGPGGVRTLDIDPITRRGPMLHIKGFHPTDNFWGAGPSEPASRDIDTDNEATEWNMRLLQNNARPGMMIMFKGSMGDEQFKHLTEMMNEKYAGAMNAGKNIVLENVSDGAEIKPYGFSPAEIDYIEGGREKARRICLAYGVPPQLLGIPGDNTYSNYEQARLAFWEDTVIPYITRYTEEFSWFLFDDNDQSVLVPDLDEIPALSPRRKELWERANTSEFLTINEKRETVGYDEVDGGDVILVAASDIPLEMAGENLVDDSDTGKPPKDPKKKPPKDDGKTKDEDLDDEAYSLPEDLVKQVDAQEERNKQREIRKVEDRRMSLIEKSIEAVRDIAKREIRFTPTIEVRPEINVEAAQVTVNTPDVKVDNHINMDPTQVTVTVPDVKVDNHFHTTGNKEKREMVLRNADGSISKTLEEK